MNKVNFVKEVKTEILPERWYQGVTDNDLPVLFRQECRDGSIIVIYQDGSAGSTVANWLKIVKQIIPVTLTISANNV